MNSDPSGEKGEQWVVIYIDKSRRGEYFDSYGLSPEILGLEAYINCFAMDWMHNHKTYFRMFVTTNVFILFVVVVVVVVVDYPTPSEGWGHGGRPWGPGSRATLLGLDQRS